MPIVRYFSQRYNELDSLTKHLTLINQVFLIAPELKDLYPKYEHYKKENITFDEELLDYKTKLDEKKDLIIKRTKVYSCTNVTSAIFKTEFDQLELCHY